MTKIKKRAHWNDYHPPVRPRLPIEPRKSFVEQEKIAFQNEDEGGLSIKDIEIPLGFTYRDLYVVSEWNEYKERLVVYLRKSKPNVNYEKEHLKYSKDLVKYEENIKAWEKEVIEYNDWKKQCEEELLKNKILEAKKFLKKHEVK